MAYPPQSSDRKAFSYLLWRGYLRWENGALVAHPDLADVRADDWNEYQRPWTAADDRLLMQRVKAGVSLSVIAVEMRRATDFIRRRGIALKLKFSPANAVHPHKKMIRQYSEATIRGAIVRSPTWAAAGRRLGVKWEALKAWGIRHGVTPQLTTSGRSLPNATRDARIRRERKAGATLVALALKYGVTRQRIFEIVKRGN